MAPAKMNVPKVELPDTTSLEWMNPTSVKSGGLLPKDAPLGPIAKLLSEAFQSGDNKTVTDNMEIVADLCRTSHNSGASKKAEIFLAGGFTMTILIMEKWNAFVSVQFQGLRVLTNALSQVDLTLTGTGVIEAILASLEKYMHYGKIRQVGIIGLFNACWGQSQANKERLVDIGGIEVMVEAMSRFSNDGNVLLWGCRLFYKVGSLKKLANKVFRARAVEAMLKLVDHPNELVRKDATKALWAILPNVQAAP